MRIAAPLAAVVLAASVIAAGPSTDPAPAVASSCYGSVEWHPGEALRACAVVTRSTTGRGDQQLLVRGLPVAPALPGGAVQTEAADSGLVLSNLREVVRLMEQSYPAAMRDEDVPGHVDVRLSVDPQGVPTVLDATPQSERGASFVEVARRAAERLRFAPDAAGRTAAVEVTIPMHWATLTCRNGYDARRDGSYMHGECRS